MQTRSSSRLVSNPSSNPTPSTNPNLKGRNRRRSKQRIEDFNLEDLSSPIVTTTDQRTMAQLFQAPTKGYEDAIVVPAITTDNFELKHGLLTLVQNKQFFGHDKEDPHAHVHCFNKITSTLKFPNVPNKSIKLMLFPFSLEGAARIWLEKEPPRSIFTWDDLVSKFINQFFPSEAWDRFKDLLRACPHHGFSKLHQLDTFYNALNSKDQDSLNSAAGDMVRALLLDKKSQNQSPAHVKAVEGSCVTCGGAHSDRNYPPTDGNVYRDNIQDFLSQAFAVNYNQENTSYRPLMMSNQIRPPGFPPVPNNQNVQRKNQNRYIPNQNQVVEDEPEVTKDTVNPTNNENTEDVQPQVVQSESLILTSNPVTSPIYEPVIAPVSASKPNPKASIPYPSRRNNERNRKKANNQIEKFYQIFKDMSFEISFDDALILMPKFASTLKALIGNKEKLSEMAQTPLNEHCSVVPLKKLLEKLGDLGKFLIPCDFPELSDHSIFRPVGVAEDVYVKVGDLTLRVGKEAITFNLDQTSRYSANYSDMTAKRIDVIDMACEEYSQEVLGFSNTISSGNPTPFYDPIVSTTSPTLTPFGNSDFLLEEVDAFLAIEDEPTSSEFYQPYLDPEGDILLLKALLNDYPSLPPPNQRNYLPKVHKELKICEAKSDKSLVDEPLTVELKDLPPHLEYAFLEGDDKLPVIISKELSLEEKTALITVLKSHKRAIAWKLSDIKGINPEFCTHKILMEEDFEPAVQRSRENHIHCPYRTFAYRRMPFGLYNAPGMFQRCMMAIFHDMIEKNMEVFMDDFFVFGNSFQCCLSYLKRMLKRCEDTNLCRNWEKSHFMGKEGIVLDHKISKQGIEVDKAKVDVITKLPHPTTVKG
uniref:Reverse transcriptase domain-containing protein n=1 Tax=Tanacetum cinerariifolium TaxID=118510 RepID=A0A6L2JNQ4_TANCI|nr:hypothetical protein [Tanacetum cinerariifolium]